MSLKKCEICSRSANVQSHDERYCKYHSIAYDNLKDKYTDWQKACGEISWKRYLETISGLQETGEWAKEVAGREIVRIRP